MLIKLAKFNEHQQEYLRTALREEDGPGMTNATKGALWGTAVLPLVGTLIGHDLGRTSDEKKKWRIEKLKHALHHHDEEAVKDVLLQDKGEWNRTLKGFLLGDIPGAIAGHISQEKKDRRNRLLERVLGKPDLY